MKFECQRTELIQALVSVKSGVSVKSTLPVLEGILFKAVNDRLYLTGSNSEISIRTAVPAIIEREGAVVLSAGFILELTRKLSGETVYFDVNDKNQVKVESMMSSFMIKGLSAEEYPDFPTINDEYDFEIDCDVLKNMIHGTLFSVAVVENIPVLTGVKLEIENDDITMIALDGYRFSLRRAKLDRGIVDPINVIVPGKSMNELDKLLSKADNKMTVRFSKSQIFFEVGDTTLVSRLLEGEFINYKHIIPSDKTTEISVERRVLMASAERAALLAKEGRNNLVKLVIDDEKIEMTSSADIGEVNEIIPVEKTGNDLQIAFNSKFLIEALRAIQEDQVKIELTTAVGPAVIRSSKENDSFIYLILPVRISN